MLDSRAAGVLVHPTSLPGPDGMGDLGPVADRFLEWIAEAGISVWQFLPLGPPGEGWSPYAARSSFAGNPLLVSESRLVETGLLERGADVPRPTPRAGRVDFRRVAPIRARSLRAAWRRFDRAPITERQAYEAFVEDRAQASWLEDWALFATLKQRHRHGWTRWPTELRDRDPGALRRVRESDSDEIGYRRFVQFLFFRQWDDLRRRAADLGVRLFGDIPFYPAHDSVDVWAHRDCFDLDDAGRAIRVAGVPPDYFSRDGQRWGNPILRWDRLAKDGFEFWVARVEAALRLADLVRIDHFRGFESYWEVDASEPTAVSGGWVAGPGRAPFDALVQRIGAPLPLVAEDLGEIGPEVERLRDDLGLPGMRVLQFGFGGDEHHRPASVPEDSVAYSGTHDNDTTAGWYRGLDEAQRDEVRRTLAAADPEIPWRMVETVYGCRARLAVCPLQDLFGLGSDARMNLPGTARGNWRWRAGVRRFTPALAARLARLAESTGRLRTPPTASGL